MISKAAALRLMEKTDHNGRRIPFSLTVITADRQQWRKKLQALDRLNLLKEGSEERTRFQQEIDSMDVGGRLIELGECILSGPRGMHAKKKAKPNPDRVSKYPHHGANRTRNIKIVPGMQTRKIHNSLIMEFNNEEVMY